MPFNREERRIQNSKQDKRVLLNTPPSSTSMLDGDESLAILSNKQLAHYIKQKGILWHTYFTRDGNQYVDKDLRVRQNSIVDNNLTVRNNLTVENDLTVEGELKGTRLIFNFGTAAASDTDFYMKTVNGVTMSSNLGYVMHRAGSIVGAGARFQCTSFSSTDTWSVDVLVNNASVFKPTGIYVDDTGYYSTYGTQARGTDTFVVGNLIQVKMNATAGSRATIDNVIGYFEVVFDD
jgi:hypothetical protein